MTGRDGLGADGTDHPHIGPWHFKVMSLPLLEVAKFVVVVVLVYFY